MTKSIGERFHSLLMYPVYWFDSWQPKKPNPYQDPNKVDWLQGVPFVIMHLMCLGVIWYGVSWPALAVCAALYAVRMFAITGFYHRYFSHRTFKTSRFCQFLFGLLGASAVQRGPLWWAAHHRKHHRFSDQKSDVHSPITNSFLWSHTGWFLAPVNAPTDIKTVNDLAKYPELCWLDRFDLVIPIGLGTLTYFFGAGLNALWPDLGTSGMQMLVVGFFLSTVLVSHCTYTINSLAHRWGSRRYDTGDFSRNNFFLALITFGEGWHNNHHYYPASARQGFYWWEIDISFYVLKVMSWMGLIWDLRPVPAHVRDSRPQQEAVAV